MNPGNTGGGTLTFTVDGILTIAPAGLIETTPTGSSPNITDFVLNSGATLYIGSAAGITTSGATGNIQVDGTRTYNAGANYIYDGTAAQVTGNGLPTPLTGSLTINNSAGVTLSLSTSVSGTLTQTSGNITVTSPVALTVGGSHYAGLNTVSGTGTYTLSIGATLETANATGINGSITTTTKTFNTANYIFDGSSAQVTGSLLPTTLTGNVTDGNSAGLTLTANEMINTPGVFTVNNGALLTLGASGAGNLINGTGTFTLASGGTLAIGSTAGITASGLTGNIQTTTRNFSTGANYIYNGTAAQAAGSGLPATVYSLTDNNTAGLLTLAQAETVTTNITLASSASISLPAVTTSFCQSLWIGSVPEIVGTWGGTGSSAVNIDSTHFAATTGTLRVGLTGGFNGQQSAQLSISGGKIIAQFYGVPNYTYVVQMNTNLTAGVGWVNVSTNLVSGIGSFSYTNSSPPASAYFRLEWLP